MSSQICVVGSLNVDFTVTTHRCPGPGETITARSLSVSAGGKGANQAVACGRALFTSPSLQIQQNITISMIGAVGSEDGHYRNLLQPMLEQSGVDTVDIEERLASQTGSATIIVEDAADGENRILVVPGANHEGMSDVQRIITCIQHRHKQRQLNAPNVIILQGEIPRETVLQLLKYFNNQKERSTHIIFNPAPVFPEGVPLSALSHTSVLVMNETEAIQMERSIFGESSFAKYLSSEMDENRLQELAKRFHDVADVRVVLITLGAKGVLFSTSTGRSGIVKGIAVKSVVDTTAAGDTFVGYFAIAFTRFLGISGKLEDFDMIVEQAVGEANVAAAVCVQRQGAAQSIPFAYESKNWIE